MRRFFVILAWVAHLLLIDAVTKEFAVCFLRGKFPVSVIDGFFNLAYVENRGCAWGMLQGHVWPLALFAVFTLFILIWKRKSIFAVETSRRWPVIFCAVAEPLLYAGIIGNLIDRIARGCVVDFFDFHYYEIYHFPCFNFADVFICVSAALLVTASFGSSPRQSRQAVPASAQK